MSAPNDPFNGCRGEQALTLAGQAAARRCAASDLALGSRAIVPADEEEARELFLDWIGANCDCSLLWDFAPDVRERVLAASWDAYREYTAAAVAAELLTWLN